MCKPEARIAEERQSPNVLNWALFTDSHGNTLVLVMLPQLEAYNVPGKRPLGEIFLYAL